MPDGEGHSPEEVQRIIREEIAAKFRKPKVDKQEQPAAEKIEIAAPLVESELPAPEPELPAPTLPEKKEELPPAAKFKTGDRVRRYVVRDKDEKPEVDPTPRIIREVKLRPGMQTAYVLSDGSETVESWLEKAPDDALAASQEIKPPSSTEPKVEAESQPERTLEQTVAEVAKDFFAEKARQANLSEDEQRHLRAMYDKIVREKGFIEKVSDATIGKIKQRKYLGWAPEFIASGVSGYILRSTVRSGLEAAISLGTVGTGAGVGALVGGAMGSFSEYRKARKEAYGVASWAKELEGKDNVVLAGQYEALKQAIADAKVKGNENEAWELVMKLRDIGTKLAQEGGPEQIFSQRLDDDKTTALTGARGEIYKKMLDTRSKHIRSKAGIGLLKGAAIGAVGGTLGALISDYVAGWRHLEDLKTAKAPVNQEIIDYVQDRAREAKEAAIERSLDHSMDQLASHSFTQHVQSGEGLTHVARGFIHDYLTQDNRIRLSREQLLYAEDYLQKHMTDHLQPGQEYVLKGQQILDAISAARTLTEDKIENLKQNWVSKVAEKVWDRTQDYSQTFDSTNQFTQGFVREAQAQGEAAAQKYLDEAAGMSLEQMAEVAKAAGAAAATAERNNLIMRYVAGAVGITAVGFGIKRAFDRFRAPKQETKTSMLGLDDKKGPEPTEPPRPGPQPAPDQELRDIMGLEPEEPQPVPQTPKSENKSLLGFLKRKKEGPQLDRTAQEAAQKEAEKLEEAKQAADPIIAWYQSQGLEAKPGDVYYRAIIPEDIGKASASTLSFSNYSDYRAHMESLSPYIRGRALRYDRVGPLSSEEFWEQKNKLSKSALTEWRTSYSKILLGLYEDRFTGKPESVMKTEEEMKAIRKELEDEYGLYFADDWSVGYDANYYAAEKIKEVLPKIPKERLNRVRFKPALKNEISKEGIILFNPDAGPSELQKYIGDIALEAANVINTKTEDAREKIYELERTYNIEVYSTVYGDKFLRAAEVFKEALAGQTNLPSDLGFAILNSPEDYHYKNRINLLWNMTSEEMRTEIARFLENKNKEGNQNG